MNVALIPGFINYSYVIIALYIYFLTLIKNFIEFLY